MTQRILFTALAAVAIGAVAPAQAQTCFGVEARVNFATST